MPGKAGGNELSRTSDRTSGVDFTGLRVIIGMARALLILALILSPALFVPGAALSLCNAEAVAAQSCHEAASVACCCCEAVEAPATRGCPCMQAPQRPESPQGAPPAEPTTLNLPHLVLLAVRPVEFTLARRPTPRLDRFPASSHGAAQARATMCVWLT